MCNNVLKMEDDMNKPVIEPVKDFKEAWHRLRNNFYFWSLVGLFGLVVVVRILGI